MEIVRINQKNFVDINKANQPFVIIGKIKPVFDSENWSYTEEIYEQSYTKEYPCDFFDYTTYIDNPNKIIFFTEL